MTITRLASAGRKHVARIAAASVALASVTALAVAGVAERASVADSFTVLGHLHWLWIPAALLLESTSMAAFAVMLRRLLAARDASVGIRPMLATAYAANAVSVSVPLAGPALATAFALRRFTRQGADGPLAGWSLLAGGVISSAAAVLIVVGGGLASGNILVTAVIVPVGVLAVAVPRRGGGGRAPPAAARRARAPSRTDAPAGIPDAAPACRRSRLIVFWLRHPRAHRGPGPSRRTAREQDAAMAANPRTTDSPAGLGAHELVLLHGQPGSPADWQLVAGRLPAPLHAVATDRPGYGSSRLPAGGFAVNARAVLDDLDSHGIARAVLVGHSYGGGVALSAASLAPDRVAAVVLLASVGPGCLTGWDRLLAAPGAGQLCAQVAWRLTPWLARARLARITRQRGRPLRPDEHVNWQVWGHAGYGRHPLWRTFLTEQRALLRELNELERAIASVRAPVLVLADPKDAVVPFETARRLTRALPDAHLQLVEGAGHNLPRRAPAVVADAIVAFLVAAQITDGPDRSASRDMNSSRVLSVLAGTGPAHRGPGALHPEEGETRWQTPVTTVRAASRPGRGEAGRPRWAPATGS
jgi:pimeloyl-ACP methyl ester carboxylesterase